MTTKARPAGHHLQFFNVSGRCPDCVLWFTPVVARMPVRFKFSSFFFLATNWNSFKFYVSSEHVEILKKLTVSCPNLEELHLGRRSSSYYQAIFDHQEADEEAYTSIANLKRLKKLTISGVKFNRGHFLQQVICYLFSTWWNLCSSSFIPTLLCKVLQSCRSLQSLHISGQFDGDFEFHRDLCSALRYAQNLREFRWLHYVQYHYYYCKPIGICILYLVEFFLSLL